MTDEQKQEYAELARQYEEYDAPYRLDPFKKIHYGTIQKWTESPSVTVKTVASGDGTFGWGCVTKPCKVRDICDLSGTSCGAPAVGEFECLAGLSRRLGLWFTRVNMENPRNRVVVDACKARHISSKVAGVGSDIYRIYYAGKRTVRPVGALHRVCFAKYAEFDAGALAERLVSSDLNFDPTDRGVRYGGPKKTWSRVAVRAAGEPRRNVFATLRTHPVFEVAPELLDILQSIGSLDDLDYTMLTRVAPTDGMIKRHTDIALDAEKVNKGPYPDKTMRFHIVLQSNPECVFHIWNIDGCRHSLTMNTGDIWYTDVRKPHAVDNHGSTVRVHLVADFFAVRDYWKQFRETIPMGGLT